MRTRYVGAGALVAAAVAFGFASQAVGSSKSATSPSEHFTFMSTVAPTGAAFSAVATGAFTDGGSATLQATKGTLKLRSGTIKITQKAGQPVFRANTKTCYEHLSENGTYKIVGGTGAYKNVTGSGKFTLTIHEIGPLVHGKCDTSSAKRVAAQAVITASGPVKLG